jgi:hypothetical protein
VRDIGVIRWELHREIFERVALRHNGWDSLDTLWPAYGGVWGALKCWRVIGSYLSSGVDIFRRLQ